MVLLAMAAAAGGINAGKDLFGYNRENYQFDKKQAIKREKLRMKMQVQRFQLFREDIRDLVKLTVDRMDIYHLVGALFLQFCVIILTKGRIQASAPPFVLSLFNLSSACAFIYLLMAVWMSMHASIASHSFGVRLLTRFVRLPILSKEQLSNLTFGGKGFEKSGIGELLRVPFADRVAQQHGGGSPVAAPNGGMEKHHAADLSSAGVAHTPAAQVHGFVVSSSFQGFRKGMVFKLGVAGLGYYPDTKVSNLGDVEPLIRLDDEEDTSTSLLDLASASDSAVAPAGAPESEPAPSHPAEDRPNRVGLVPGLRGFGVYEALTTGGGRASSSAPTALESADGPDASGGQIELRQLTDGSEMASRAPPHVQADQYLSTLKPTKTDDFQYLPQDFEPAIVADDIFSAPEGSKPARHVELFRELQSKWQCYDAYCRVCMGLGVNQMLQVLSYYGVCHTLVENHSPTTGFALVVCFQCTTVTLAILDLVGLRQRHIIAIQIVGVVPCFLTACIVAGGARNDKGVLNPADDFPLSPLCFLATVFWLECWLRVSAPSKDEAQLPRRFRQMLFLDVFGDASALDPAKSEDKAYSVIAGQHAEIKERLPWQLVCGMTRVLQLSWFWCFAMSFLKEVSIYQHDYGYGVMEQQRPGGRRLCERHWSFERVEAEWPHGRFFRPQALFCLPGAEKQLAVGSPFGLYSLHEAVAHSSSFVERASLPQVAELGRQRFPPSTISICANWAQVGHSRADLPSSGTSMEACWMAALANQSIAMWPYSAGRWGPNTTLVPVDGDPWTLFTGAAMPCGNVSRLLPGGSSVTKWCLVFVGWDGQSMPIMVVPVPEHPGLRSQDMFASAGSGAMLGVPLHVGIGARRKDVVARALHLEPQGGRLWALMDTGELEAWDLFSSQSLGRWRPTWPEDIRSFRFAALCEHPSLGLFVVGHDKTVGPALYRARHLVE